jgi:UDP-3-O-[3-hydroxymyristoyl] glucosamine N-acyltransferase
VPGTLGELGVRFGCVVQGDPDTRIVGVGTLQDAGPEQIAFLANPRYRKFLAGTRAGAVILNPEVADDYPGAALLAENPYLIYARVAALLYPSPRHAPGISPAASVDPTARIAEDVWVGPAAVVEAGATVGAGCFVGPGCHIARDARLGRDCRLVARVVVCHGVMLGDRVIVQPGAVIGADGFGIAQSDAGWVKVPQLGSVRIGNDVEIGANTCIDRGTIDDTVIADGVKMDNLIQIGHNVRVGEHTVIAGCAGISGSTVIGRRCMIAGAVGIVGHLEIGDDVVFTGQTMVSRSVREPGVYSSALPMDEAGRWRRNSARFRQLDDLARRLTKLEKTLLARSGDSGGDNV